MTRLFHFLRVKLGFAKITIDGKTHYVWRFGRHRQILHYLFNTYGPSQTTGNIRATEIRCDTKKPSVEASVSRDKAVPPNPTAKR